MEFWYLHGRELEAHEREKENGLDGKSRTSNWLRSLEEPAFEVSSFGWGILTVMVIMLIWDGIPDAL